MNRMLLFLTLSAASSACLDARPGSSAGDTRDDPTRTPPTTTAPRTDERDVSQPDSAERDSGASTTTATTATGSDASGAQDTGTEPDVAGCEPVGTPCIWQGCCPGTFCAGGPYVYGECMAPQPNGAPCMNDGWCQSEHCHEGLCANATCGEVGAGCVGPDDCCSGWCEFVSYVEPMSRCQARVAEGEPCFADYQCETGICQNSQCVFACQAANEGCLWDSDCCEGNFCELGRMSCTPKRASGGACDWDGECADGTCRDGVCAAVACVTNESEGQCYYDGECCSGACSWDGSSYALGFCFTPQVEGACVRDAWCASGKCVEGMCAAP